MHTAQQRFYKTRFSEKTRDKEGPLGIDGEIMCSSQTICCSNFSGLSGELYPTLRSVYPLVHGIPDDHLLVRAGDSPEMMCVRNAVADKIKKRFMVGFEHNCP